MRSRELAELQRTLFAPLAAPELEAVRTLTARNPFPVGHPLYDRVSHVDAASWRFPEDPLPRSLLEFLAYSNGGDFTNGERWFQMFSAIDPAHGLRAMMLGYLFPEFMPLALPFALNGEGTFYVLDMRHAPRDGEYPVVASRPGSFGWSPGSHWPVAETLVDAFGGTSDVHDLRPGAAADSALANEGSRRVDVHLLSVPPSGLRGLLRIKEETGYAGGNAELLALSRRVPAPLVQDLELFAVAAFRARLGDERDCLLVTEAGRPDLAISMDEFESRLRRRYGPAAPPRPRN